jgi:hypothetical protein
MTNNIEVGVFRHGLLQFLVGVICDILCTKDQIIKNHNIIITMYSSSSSNEVHPSVVLKLVICTFADKEACD